MSGHLDHPDSEAYWHGATVPLASLVQNHGRHLEDCKARPVYKRGKDEPLLHISLCASGCPVLQRTLARGRELAEKYDW